MKNINPPLPAPNNFPPNAPNFNKSKYIESILLFVMCLENSF